MLDQVRYYDLRDAALSEPGSMPRFDNIKGLCVTKLLLPGR